MKRALPALVILFLFTAGCIDNMEGDALQDPGDPAPAAPPGPGPAGEPVELQFNGSRAFDFAHEQVRREDGSVRYRVPGTGGNTEAAVLIHGHLARLGFDASFDHFNATYGCERTPMHNVVGVRPGTDPSRTVILGAHYDTRPIAEKDPDAEARDEPIEGANDGASGVGVLLALAEALDGRDVAPNVVFLFFDGEDGGGYKGRECTDWILGSRHYAGNMTTDEIVRTEAMVLVDLVGAPDLRLPREQHSTDRLQDDIYAIAGSLGYPQFTNATGIAVIDDHVPFLEQGIPAVDLIHLRETNSTQWDPFPEVHHKHSDTMDNLSAESLEAVGRVVERWVLAQ